MIVQTPQEAVVAGRLRSVYRRCRQLRVEAIAQSYRLNEGHSYRVRHSQQRYGQSQRVGGELRDKPRSAAGSNGVDVS